MRSRVGLGGDKFCTLWVADAAFLNYLILLKEFLCAQFQSYCLSFYSPILLAPSAPKRRSRKFTSAVSSSPSPKSKHQLNIIARKTHFIHCAARRPLGDSVTPRHKSAFITFGDKAVVRWWRLRNGYEYEVEESGVNVPEIYSATQLVYGEQVLKRAFSK